MPLRNLACRIQAYYRWRRKYGGLEVDEARRLKQLEDAKFTAPRLGLPKVDLVEVLPGSQESVPLVIGDGDVDIHLSVW